MSVSRMLNTGADRTDVAAMNDQKPEMDQLDTLRADFREQKEENAALRRLLIENGDDATSSVEDCPVSSNETARGSVRSNDLESPTSKVEAMLANKRSGGQ